MCQDILTKIECENYLFRVKNGKLTERVRKKKLKITSKYLYFNHGLIFLFYTQYYLTL